MSAVAGTPFILWGSDSHKTMSLYDLFEYPANFFEVKTLSIHVDDIVEEAVKVNSERNEFVRLIDEHVSVMRLKTNHIFDFLDNPKLVTLQAIQYVFRTIYDDRENFEYFSPYPQGFVRISNSDTQILNEYQLKKYFP